MRVTPHVRRAAWGLADQAASSLSNFILFVVVARAVDTAQFGEFSLVLAVYFLIVGVPQGLPSLPPSVKYSAATDEEYWPAATPAAGLSLILGIGLGIGCVAAGILLSREYSLALIALGCMLPGLLLQDGWRYVFVAEGRPAKAAINDGLWMAIQAAGFIAIYAVHMPSALSFIIAWGAAASVGAVVGCFQARHLPRLNRFHYWFRNERSLATWYSLEALVNRGSSSLVFLAIGAITGLAGLGAIRGAMVPYRPLNLAYLGAMFVAVPEGVRVVRTLPQRYGGLVLALSGITGLITLAWSAIVLAPPDWAGRQLLGSTWMVARLLLFPMALQNLAVGLSIGAQVGLKALALARMTLHCQTFNAVLLVGGGSIGAVVGGPSGGATGLAVGAMIGTMIWLVAALRPATNERAAVVE